MKFTISKLKLMEMHNTLLQYHWHPFNLISFHFCTVTSVNTIILLVLSHHINKTAVIFIDENLQFHNSLNSVIVLFI